MRRKKTREVNIFSASVVDLFASGLGVFLIVSIIALVNQKKEVSRLQTEYTEKESSGFESERVDKLKKSLENKLEEIAKLQRRISSYELMKKNKKSSEQIQKNFAVENAKIATAIQEKKLQEKISSLKKKNESLKREVSGLKQKNFALQKSRSANLKAKYESYAVGSKIRLESVHFYPGTVIPIEPYASLEIERFAAFLLNSPKVTVEVSGHIFLSKKEIESDEASDETNLSGRRAQVVCDKLLGFGVSKDRLRCVGYGANRFLHLTDDSYSKEAQLNRRVEVEILTK